MEGAFQKREKNAGNKALERKNKVPPEAAAGDPIEMEGAAWCHGKTKKSTKKEKTWETILWRQEETKAHSEQARQRKAHLRVQGTA